MRLVAFGQKFEVVSECHWFLYVFSIFDRVTTANAWRYIFALDSIASVVTWRSKRTNKSKKRTWSIKLSMAKAEGLYLSFYNWSDISYNLPFNHFSDLFASNFYDSCRESHSKRSFKFVMIVIIFLYTYLTPQSRYYRRFHTKWKINSLI